MKKFKPKVEFRQPLHVFTGLKEAADKAALNDPNSIIHVQPIQVTPSLQYGGHTSEAVQAAIDRLSGDGKSGPYAVVLNSTIHSDTYASQQNTFIYAAEVIKPQATAGYFSTNGLPARTGLVISLNGGSMDRIVGTEPNPITQYTQMDDDGFYHFRVYECFALRLMDSGTVVELSFDPTISTIP